MPREGHISNQPLYREVNRRIRDVTDSFGTDGWLQVLCECGRPDCIATFELPQEHVEVLDEENFVLVAREHRSPDYGALIAEHDGFLVLEAASD